jgi:SAM-dependent methyltransferase
MVSIKKLNLGCGEFKKEGYLNLDISPEVRPDLVHDLNAFPYPFHDNQFDSIEADHVLEHLENPFLVMKELHRISRNKALLTVRVPHFSRGFSHPEHKRGFDITFPLYFQPSFKGGYQGVEFELKRLNLFWFAQTSLKRQTLSRVPYVMGYGLGSVLSFLADLSPVLCSRLWCFWVGGFEEIEFQFVVKK